MKTIYAALAAVAIMGSAASAADLGGNCCADLEERVADLEATAARKGNRKVSLQLYGQVSAAVLYTKVDGFDESKVIDNGVSGSFLGLRGAAKIRQGSTAGFIVELGLDPAGGGVINSVLGNEEVGVKRAAIFLETELGKVTIGKFSRATDGLAELSLANTDVASKSLSLQPISNAYLFGINLPFTDLRGQVVRYDSPLIANFLSVSASWGGENEWDAALRVAQDAGDFRFAAGLGYREGNNNLLDSLLSYHTKGYTGSASVLHTSSGLFLSGTYAKTDIDGICTTLIVTSCTSFSAITTKTWAVQGGIERKWFDLGKTTFYGEYGSLKIDGISVDPGYWGLGAVQAIDAAALDLFVAYRSYGLDGAGNSDVQTLMSGARIRF